MSLNTRCNALQAAKVAPKDPDLRKKLSECEKAVKRIRFEEALATPESEITHISDTIELDSFIIESGYKGPMMEGEGLLCAGGCRVHCTSYFYTLTSSLRSPRNLGGNARWASRCTKGGLYIEEQQNRETASA
jgi:hypothetical protein